VRNRRRTGVRDPELLELFENDPEGLAIVDAIASTQSRHRRARQFAVVGATATLLAVAAAVIVSGASRAGVAEHALSALSQNSVVHVRLVDMQVAARLVNLRTGEPRPIHHVVDEWLSKSGSRRRIRDSFLNQTVTDATSPVRRGASGDAEAFLFDYRRALAAKNVSPSGITRLAGENGYVLRFINSRHRLVRVIVDSESYEPVLVEIRGGPTLKVTEFGSATKEALAPKRTTDRLEPSQVVSAQAARPIRAAKANRLPLRLNGMAATSARELQLRSGGREDVAIEVTYLDAATRRRLKLTMSGRPYSALGWTDRYAQLRSGTLLALSQSSLALAKIGDRYFVFESGLDVPELRRAARRLE
jgi:hypothetical protein